MKFDAKGQLPPPTNIETMKAQIAAGTVHLHYQGLLLTLADTVDRALGGKDTYAIVGLTRGRDALLLTVTEGINKARAGGSSLLEVSTDAERFL